MSRKPDEVLLRARILAVRWVLSTGYPLAEVSPDIVRFGLLEEATEGESLVLTGQLPPNADDEWASLASATLVWALGMSELEDLEDIDAVGAAMDAAMSGDSPTTEPVATHVLRTRRDELSSRVGSRSSEWCVAALEWHLDPESVWDDP